MTKEQKNRVLRAAEYLRKPTLQQWQGSLSNESGDAKCCLGHLCDFFQQETGMGNWIPYSGPSQETGMEYLLNNTASYYELPSQVADWFGLMTDPEIPLTHQTASASKQNDVCGCTLLEIADGFQALAEFAGEEE